MSSSTTTVPGYIRAWKISALNSEVRFIVRHLGVTNLHGRFNDLAGIIITSGTIERSSVAVTIGADSIDTGFPGRDTYIRGEDVLASRTHGELRFTSTLVHMVDGSVVVDGNLTIHGITKPVRLTVDMGGFGENPMNHSQVLGISATTTLRRSDFGLAPRVPTLVVGDDVMVHLDIHAVPDFYR